MRFVLFLLSVLPLHGAQSVIVGTQSTLSLPGQGDTRMEFRIHGWGASGTLLSAGSSGLRAYRDNSTNELWLIDDRDVVGNVCKFSLAGRTDVLARAQRDTTTNVFLCEVWNVDGSGYAYFEYAMTPGAALSFPGEIGAAPSTLAWWRIHTTLLPRNSRPPTAVGLGPLYADWRFEGNSNDSSGNGRNWTLTGATYSGTPAFGPVSSPRTANAPVFAARKALKVGTVEGLDGTASFSQGDVDTLTYLWQQIAGPATLYLSDRTIAAPKLRAPMPGQYTVRLRVTDPGGATAIADLDVGAIATDGQGVVIVPSSVAAIFPSMTAWGTSPWPWLDDRHVWLSEFYGGLLDTDYAAVWRTAQPGTITTTDNSATITGSGTTFLTTFACNGSDYIITRYTDATGTRYRGYNVASCASNTSLTINGGSNLIAVERPQAGFDVGSGMLYGKMTISEVSRWTGPSTNVNYYDNVLAHYAAYYRTGLTKHRDFARELADRWIENPLWDVGRKEGAYAMARPRLHSLVGLMVRAADGKPEYWTRMEYIIDKDLPLLSSTAVIEDVREDAYRLHFTALGALYHPNPTKQSTYLGAVTSSITSRWGPQRKPGGNWYIGYNYAVSTAEVVNGNPAVTSAGAFTESVMCSTTAHGADRGQAVVWFSNSITNGDNRAYRCIWNNANSITLTDEAGNPTPYQGTTGTKQWQSTRMSPTWEPGLIGQGTAPYQLGMAGQVMAMVYRATNNATIIDWVTGAVDWIISTGYMASSKGIWYGREYPMCEPDPSIRIYCAGGDGDLGSRAYLGEVVGAFAAAELLSPNSARRTRGDEHVAVNMGKLGGPQSITGMWNTEIDNGFTQTSKKAKDFGFWFGFGGVSNWLGARLGGLVPPDIVSVRVTFRLADVAGAIQARVSVLSPSGATTQTTCTTSPCAVTVDRRQGTHAYTTEYLSAGGAVLARSETDYIHFR